MSTARNWSTGTVCACACACACGRVCVWQVPTLTLRYLDAASAKSLSLFGHRLETEARSKVSAGCE